MVVFIQLLSAIKTKKKDVDFKQTFKMKKAIIIAILFLQMMNRANAQTMNL